MLTNYRIVSAQVPGGQAACGGREVPPRRYGRCPDSFGAEAPRPDELSVTRRVSANPAKNNLSALIDSVKGGSPVLIVDRGRPVARLEPVSGVRPDDDSRLARLVREGIVRPGRGGLPKSLFATKPPRVKKGASGVRALLDDRRDGR